VSIQRNRRCLLLSLLLAIACAKDEAPFAVEPQVAPPEAEHVAYDPADPTRLLIVEDAGAISTWHIDGEIPERTLTIMTDAVTARFDGEEIVSVHRDGALRLWTRTGRQLKLARPSGGAVPTAMQVTPTAIIVGDTAGMLHIWSRDLARRRSFALHDAPIVGIAPQPGNETTFATAAKDEKASIWRTSGAGAPVLVRTFDVPGVKAISMSRKGAVAVADGGVTIFDTAGVPHRHGQYVRYVAFSTTLEIVVGSGPGGPIVFNADATGRPWTHRRRDSTDVGEIAFTPGGDRFAATARPWGFQVWTLDAALTAEPAAITREPLSNRYAALGAPMHVAALGDGFVSANDAEVMFLDKFGRVSRREKLPAEYEGVSELATSSRHDLVVVLTASGTVLAVGREGRQVLAPNGIDAIAVSHLTGTIAMATKDGKVRFVSPAGKQLRPALETNDLRAIAFTADDALIGATNTELRWYSREGRLLRTAPEEINLGRIIVSPDASRVALVEDYELVLLDGNGSLLAKIQADTRFGVSAAAFSPREPLLATSIGGSTRFWNLDGSPRGDSLELPMTPFGERMPLDSLAFSETQDLMIAGIMQYRSVTLWSVSARPRASVAPPGFGDAGVNITPDNRITWVWDALGVHVWTPGGQCAKTLNVGEHRRYGPLRLDRHGRRLLATPYGGGETSLVDIDTEKITPLDRHRLSAFVGDEIVHLEDEPYSSAVIWETAGGKPARIELPFQVFDLLQALRSGSNDELAVATLDHSPERKSIVAVVKRQDGLTWQETVSGWTQALAADPNSDTFAISTAEGAVMVWERTGQRMWKRSLSFQTFDGSDAHALAFSPSGPRRVAVGTRGGTIAIYDFQRNAWTKARAIGYWIKQLGWNSKRLWAVLSSGQVVYLDHDLTPLATLTVNGTKGVITTPSGWYSGDDELVRFYTGAKREAVPKVDAATMYNTKNVAALVTGRGQFWHGLNAWLDARGASVRRWITKHSLWEIGAMLVGSVYALLLAAVFIIWIVRPNRIAYWAMIPLASPNAPPLKRWTELLTVVGYLGHTNRAVEAWLRHSRKELTTLFDEADSVVARTRYVDLGNASDIDTWRNDVAASRPSAVWITGPGGCGKTTLAIQLAKAAAHSPARPLPLVINTDWKGDLTDAVTARMTVHRKRPTRAMIERLADRGRLVLIVDGLSERRVSDAAAAVESATVFRYRIVASRGESAEGSAFRRIEVGPLTPVRLRSFVELYLPAGEVDEALQDINSLAEGQPIRPLFARLALEQRNSSRELPKSYPRLVQKYVLELAPRGPSALRADDFLRAARIAGLACVEEDFAPHLISVEILRGHLRAHAQRLPFMSDVNSHDDVSDIEIVDQLVECGLMERVISLGVPQARFAFDPIAEYLGVMEIAAGGESYSVLRDRVERSESALRDALQRVDAGRDAV
jgi:WD40 repeat protein